MRFSSRVFRVLFSAGIFFCLFLSACGSQEPTASSPSDTEMITVSSQSSSTTTDVPAPCSHAFGEWETVVVPDAGIDGLRRRVCVRCGESEEEILPALPEHVHDYEIISVVASCTEDGYTVRRCACGVTLLSDRTPACGHSFGAWETVSEATRDCPGYEIRTCFVCGEREGRDTDPLPDPEGTGEPHVHDYSFMSEYVSAGCTYEGGTFSYCDCGAILHTDVEPARGHVWDEWVQCLAPTDDLGGLETRACSVCGETELRTVPALKWKETPMVTTQVEYLCQRDERWGNVALGCGTVGANGCAPTAVAMALHLYGIEVTPDEVCTWLYENTPEFNHAFHGTSGTGTRLAAEHYGRRVVPIATEEEFRQHLAAGAAVVGAQGYGYFSTQPLGTHGILFLAGSDPDLCLCYDPYYVTKCGEYDLRQVWNERSTQWVDLRYDGVTHYAIY